MRFISKNIAPNLVGLILMPVMISALPFIILVQKMPYEHPEFWSTWADAVGNVVPYAIPLAICTALISKYIIGRFTIL